MVRAPNQRLSPPQDPDPAWSPAANPAVAALLDHLAEALAHEYVRLMEAATARTAADDDTTSTEVP